MIKYLLLITLIGSLLIAQEKSQTQSIELPDFVITGKENIKIPKMQKSFPEFVPLLSNDFFMPSYPNEEQTTIELPTIKNEIISIGNYHQRTNALIKLSAGLQTWPKGEFYYTDWMENFNYKAQLFGVNELEFENKAGISNAGINLGSGYYVKNESKILPGLEINLDGNYLYESFHFYGSDNPSLNRRTNTGYANLSFNYATDPSVSFGLILDDLFYEQQDDAVSENIFGTQAYLKFKLLGFDLKLEGNYKNQSTSSENITVGNQYYFNGAATVGFKMSNRLNIRAGVYLAESEGNTFFSPIGFGSLKLSNNISIFGEFAPDTEFLTLNDFYNHNRYYQFNSFVNLFVENNFNAKAGIKFEYEKYFEISVGLGYLNSDNNFYFEDNVKLGLFTIYPEDIENSFAYINFLFRKGPFGEFYAEAQVQNKIASNGNILPYSSTFMGALNYSYHWSEGFGLKLGMKYFSESYTDLENINKIPSMIDLSASFYYEMFQNFRIILEFENLLNEKYYYFRNYKAKPIDILAGVEFRW